MSLETPDHVTAPDLSYTLTETAFYVTMTALVRCPPPPGIPDEILEGAVAMVLGRSEGYTDEVTISLFDNPYFAWAVRRIIQEFQAWQEDNV